MTGAVLGMLCWLAWRQLSTLDPFGARGIDALVVVGAAGAALGATRLRPVLWVGAGLLCAMILVVGYTPLVAGPARSLVRTDSAERVDAVVVLSSSFSEDELLDVQGTDRLLRGVELVREGMSKNLVVTKLTVRRDAKVLTSQPDQARIAAFTPAGTRVFYVEPVYRTRDEAMRTSELARRKGWRTVAVVTSPLHTRRACAAFEKVGLAVTCVPARSRDIAVGSLRGMADRLRAFQLWSYEVAAAAEYRRRGWL